MNYECGGCEKVFDDNPPKCPDCGTTVFSPTDEEVDKELSDQDLPDELDEEIIKGEHLDENGETEEIVYDIVGMAGHLPPDKLQIGESEGGYKLYIERSDGEGVAIDVDREIFESLRETFILTENE